MKFKVTLLLVALSFTSIIFAQAPSKTETVSSLAKSDDEKAQIQLTTTIIRQFSCSPEFIGFDLKLTFKNTGEVPVILNKKYLMGGSWVSRNTEAAAAKKYETYLTYSFVGSHEGLEPPVFSDFLILRPGEVYEREDGAAISTTNVKPEAGGYLHPGTHVLQVVVGTWPYVVESEPYRRKWRDYGFLWSKGLRSLPTPFSFEENRPILKCSSDEATK